MISGKIQVKAMCLFMYEERVLLGRGYDTVKDEYFYRVPGGHIEFQETAEQALRREIEEELRSGISGLKFRTVVENIFEYRGEPGHEVIFLYSGTLQNKDLYNQRIIPFDEDDGSKYEAEWVSVKDIIGKRVIVYPTFDYSTILS